MFRWVRRRHHRMRPLLASRPRRLLAEASAPAMKRMRRLPWRPVARLMRLLFPSGACARGRLGLSSHTNCNRCGCRSNTTCGSGSCSCSSSDSLWGTWRRRCRGSTRPPCSLSGCPPPKSPGPCAPWHSAPSPATQVGHVSPCHGQGQATVMGGWVAPNPAPAPAALALSETGGPEAVAVMAASGRSAVEGISLLTSGAALRLWKLDAADTAQLGSLVTSASSALEMMEKRTLSPLDATNRILVCLDAFGASLARASAAAATAAAAGHTVHGTAGGGHFLAPVEVTPAPVAPQFPPGIPLPRPRL